MLHLLRWVQALPLTNTLPMEALVVRQGILTLVEFLMEALENVCYMSPHMVGMRTVLKYF